MGAIGAWARGIHSGEARTAWLIVLPEDHGPWANPRVPRRRVRRAAVFIGRVPRGPDGTPLYLIQLVLLVNLLVFLLILLVNLLVFWDWIACKSIALFVIFFPWCYYYLHVIFFGYSSYRGSTRFK